MGVVVARLRLAPVGETMFPPPPGSPTPPPHVLYGGAFHPPHPGHVPLADAARERFRGERLVRPVNQRPGARAGPPAAAGPPPAARPGLPHRPPPAPPP